MSLSSWRHCFSLWRSPLIMSGTAYSWPWSCSWQESQATSLLLFWVSATKMSKSPCFWISKERNFSEGWLKLHSEIQRATWVRKKRLCSLLHSLHWDWKFGWTSDNYCRNEFRISDVPDEPCLLLCPHVNLLTLIFTNQAFAAPELTSSEQLFRLRILSGQKQLLVPLKEVMQHISLFCWFKPTVNEVWIFNDKALPDSTLCSWMITLESVTGIELLTGPYTFQCGSGEALDNSSE